MGTLNVRTYKTDGMIFDVDICGQTRRAYGEERRIMMEDAQNRRKLYFEQRDKQMFREYADKITDKITKQYGLKQ